MKQTFLSLFTVYEGSWETYCQHFEGMTFFHLRLLSGHRECWLLFIYLSGDSWNGQWKLMS